MITRAATAICLSLFLAASLHSQNRVGADTARAMRNSAALVSPDLDSPIRALVPTVVFEAERGTEEVSAQAGITSGAWGIALKASTALDEDADEIELGGTLDGLTSGTTVALTLTGQRWGSQTKQFSNVEWCSAMKEAKRLASNFQCSPFDQNSLPDELREEFLAAAAFSYRPVLFALEMSGGPRVFDYADEASLETATVDRWESSVNGAVGVVTRAGLISVGAAYTSTYRTGRARTVCTPLGTVDEALECRDVRLGVPERERGFSGRAELKSFLSASLAVNPRVRFTDDEWVVEVPMYFIPASSRGLIGGVTPQYNSETDRFGMSLFVGKAFGLNITRL